MASADGVATKRKDGREATLGIVFWIICLYFIFQYVRPHDLVPGLSPLRIPMLLTITTALLYFAYGDKRVLKDPLVILYGTFIALCALSILWAVNHFWVKEISVYLTTYLLAGLLPVAGLLQDRRKLSAFFTVWVFSHLALAYVSLTSDGRGTGSFLGDENDMALAINMALPFAYFLMQSKQRGLVFKGFMLLTIAAIIAAVIYSDSRGGLVGLAAVMAGILFTTKHRIRNALVIGVFAGVAYLAAPDGYVDDMRTMADPDDATRGERLYSWRLSMDMFRDYPIAGVGAGNWGWRVQEYEIKRGEYTGRRGLGGRVSHSLYFTLIPDLGTVGVILFGSMTVLIVLRLRRIITREDALARERAGKRGRVEITEAGLLARAMFVSLFGLFSSGAFISVLYYPHFWFLIGFVLALDYATSQAPQKKGVFARAGLPQLQKGAEPVPGVGGN
jgi:O-antigen ligase